MAKAISTKETNKNKMTGMVITSETEKQWHIKSACVNFSSIRYTGG